MNKYLKIIILIIISITTVAYFGCRISTNEEPVVVETGTGEADLEESGSAESEEVSTEVNEDEKDKDAEDPVIDQDTKESIDEDRLMDTLIDFFDAVKQDT